MWWNRVVGLKEDYRVADKLILSRIAIRGKTILWNVNGINEQQGFFFIYWRIYGKPQSQRAPMGCNQFSSVDAVKRSTFNRWDLVLAKEMTMSQTHHGSHTEELSVKRRLAEAAQWRDEGARASSIARCCRMLTAPHSFIQTPHAFPVWFSLE